MQKLPKINRQILSTELPCRVDIYPLRATEPEYEDTELANNTAPMVINSESRQAKELDQVTKQDEEAFNDACRHVEQIAHYRV